MTASYQADSYVRAKSLLNELITNILHNVSQAEKAAATIAQVADNLDAMELPYPQGYMQLATYIINQSGAHPNDPAWQAMKAEMEKIISDFKAAKAHYAAMTAAINSL